MKRFLTFSLFLLVSLRAFAVQGGQVKYAGGTVQGVDAGVVGRLDATDNSVFVFEYAGSKITIPYASIDSHEYTKEVARHLGILPAIAVALFKTRQYRHIFRISYRDPNGAAQVAVFEVPKGMQTVLRAVLDKRAPHTVKLPPCGCVPSGS